MIQVASMGPRPEDRGESTRWSWLAIATRASMGPRPEDRGEQDGGGIGVPHRAASMGPRPEDRGEHFGPLPVFREQKRFNGATARRPWRATPWRPLTSAPDGFNGATARRPWRVRALLRRIDDDEKLQWGHGPKTVESPLICISTPTPGSASMGPRPEDRGEAECTAPDDRGAGGLQWGHGPKTVERSSRRHDRGEDEAASMGPRPEDRGEVYPGRVTYREDICFNGATARRPWRGRYRGR